MRMKRFFLCALCVLTVFPIVSCSGGGEKNVEGSEKVVLCDFATYNPNFSLMRVLNNFGVISVNKDANYVKSGGTSCKVQPMGGYNSSTQPLMYYPFYSEKYGFDYRDLSKMKSISAEVFNAADKEVNMTFGLVMQVLNTDMVNKTNPQKVVLKKGWNTVTYDIDVSIINILYDVKDAQGVYFGFERIGSRDVEDAPVLYIDDITMIFTQKEAKIEELLSFSENEICSFDKLYQKYVIYSEVENPACEPEFSVVKTADYGVAATSGDSALKVTTKGGSGNTYQRIVVPEAIMHATDLVKVPEAEWDSTYFCFDLYALSEKGLAFYPEFFDDGYGVCYNKWATTAYSNKWTTYKIKLSELTKSMIQKPGFFRLAWGEYSDEPFEREFLMDSFRIEKI